MQDGTIYIADTSGLGSYYEKPMLILQEIIKGLQETNNVLQQEISTLKAKVATLEANEVTKSEVEKGFNNVITVVDNNKLRIRNNALEDEGVVSYLTVGMTIIMTLLQHVSVHALRFFDKA